MARKVKIKNDDVTPSSLVPALDFLAPLLLSVGKPDETHVTLHGNYAVAWNGVIAAGHPIEEDITAVVPGLDLRAAVGRAGAGMVLSIEPPLLKVISGAAGRFRVTLLCLGLADISHALPDPQLVPMGEALREGWAAIGALSTDGHPRVICASILMRPNTMCSTDGNMFLEYWHGLDLPTFSMPKKTVAYLLKIKQPMTGFGFSGNTATFYFEGGIWVRTQLFTEGWNVVNTELLFQGWQHTGAPVPFGLWGAIDNVAPFLSSNDAPVWFEGGSVQSDRLGTIGAVSACEGAPQGLAVAARYLGHMRAQSPGLVEWHGGYAKDRVCFAGPKSRGMIAKIRMPD